MSQTPLTHWKIIKAVQTCISMSDRKYAETLCEDNILNADLLTVTVDGLGSPLGIIITYDNESHVFFMPYPLDKERLGIVCFFNNYKEPFWKRLWLGE